jgi:hypothetical protein
MSMTENGRYCNSCSKTVIDFSSWEIEDIKNYLINTNTNVCGHFKSLQVEVKRPRHHQFLLDIYSKTENRIKTSYIKSFTLSFIMLCLFLVGCNNERTNNGRTMGALESPNFHENLDSLEREKPKDNERITGLVASPPFHKYSDSSKIKEEAIHVKKHTKN